MNITAERKQTFDFSDAYYTSGVVMAVAKDSKVKTFKDLKGKTVALKNGDSWCNLCEVDSEQVRLQNQVFQWLE